jgi:alpha-tubulin suppressor-like RCC1 family protein
MMGSNSKG